MLPEIKTTICYICWKKRCNFFSPAMKIQDGFSKWTAIIWQGNYSENLIFSAQFLSFYLFLFFDLNYFSAYNISAAYTDIHTHLLLVKCCCVTFLIEFVEKTITHHKSNAWNIYFDETAKMPTDNKLSFSITIYIQFLCNSSFITCNWSLVFLCARFVVVFFFCSSHRICYSSFLSFFRHCSNWSIKSIRTKHDKLCVWMRCTYWQIGTFDIYI